MTAGELVVVSGIAVHVFKHRDDAPCLLMLHGNGLHGMCFLPLIRKLQPHYSCYAVDFRGHGDSAPPQHDDGCTAQEAQCATAELFRQQTAQHAVTAQHEQSIGQHEESTVQHAKQPPQQTAQHSTTLVATFVDDIRAVVRELKLHGCFCFGHSIGGTVALRVEQLDPGSFRAIFCYEPIVFSMDSVRGRSVGEQLARVAARRRMEFDSFQAAADELSRKQPYSSFHADALSAYLQHGLREMSGGRVRLKCDRDVEAAVFSSTRDVATATLNGMPHMRATCAVVYAAGVVDARSPHSVWAEAAAQHAKRTPLARFERYNALGHMGPMEQPQWLAARIHHAFSCASSSLDTFCDRCNKHIEFPASKL